MIIKINEKAEIRMPSEIAKILQGVLNSEEPNDQMKEHFWSVGLNVRQRILYIELVSLGILNASIIHPREVFRLAIQKSVNSIIIVHNHPSGNTVSSEDDAKITKRLKKAGEILGIKILDHIIITKNNFRSLKEDKKF